MLSKFAYLVVAQLGVAAASVSGSKPCTSETFFSLDLSNIKISSVDVTSKHVAWPSTSDLTNSYGITKNGTVSVCQLTVNYTHPGWKDKVTTWITLPMDSWNERFTGMGGGGYTTGKLVHNSQAAFEGFASVSTDGGHGASATTESWALASEGNVNWPNLNDFASVALDDAASLGKAATKIFYGRPAKYSYWNGCSTGGRQGHMMAQRYPTQYDGILAGAPAINWDKFIPAEYWPQVMMKELEHYPSSCEMNALTQSAVDACDELDGVKDGIISMEGLCRFDPLTVVGKTVKCTSPDGIIKISKKAAQIAAAIWSGAKASDGSALWYGLPYGSPLIYLGGTNCTSLTDCKSLPFSISSQWVQLFLEKNSTFDISTVGYEQFDNLFRQSVNEYASAIGTRDTDLTRFKEAGGKMISWHGMKDQLIFFNGTEHYYRQVLERDPKAYDFYRFFPAPGVEHCSGGPGWYPGESMKALMDWVENGVAPETLNAVATPSATGGAQPPLRTAGLCPWPKVMTFVGGNSNKASSFVCK